jgi:hypothetical protein
MYDTHTPAEWAEALSLAAGAYAALSVPYFLLVDAELADFDPRPAARRALESGRLDRLVHAYHDVNWALASAWHIADEAAEYARHAARDAVRRGHHAPRDAAISAAALLMLLSPATPEGAR